MAMAKAISMTVRPIQSADLCYPVSGIIEYQPENLLGMSVTAYDLAGLQGSLEPSTALPTASDLMTLSPTIAQMDLPGPSDLMEPISLDGPDCDGPQEIDASLASTTLSRLRGEDIAAQLLQAIAWYGLKHSADQADEAIERRGTLLGRSPEDPHSVASLLDKLSGVLRLRYEALRNLYDANQIGEIADAWSESSATSDTSGDQKFHTQTDTKTTYFGREYEFPPADNRARWLRSEISLRQEQLAAFRLVKLNSPSNVLRERAMTAGEIRKLQLAYIDTYLVAPFDGLVTAVFRNVGDYVTAGQPVLRLENDKTVYLVGTIKYRGLIRVGDQATVTTTLFGQPGASLTQITGTVSAVRGHEPVDEQWNVIIRCDNQAGTGRILPLNYNFDFNSTEVDVVSV